MTYAELLRALYYAQYRRVERDDRLLDVFPTQDREKGIELWERWLPGTVRLLRVRLPFAEEKLMLFELSRTKLEEALLRNKKKILTDRAVVASGAASVHQL